MCSCAFTYAHKTDRQRQPAPAAQTPIMQRACTAHTPWYTCMHALDWLRRCPQPLRGVLDLVEQLVLMHERLLVQPLHKLVRHRVRHTMLPAPTNPPSHCPRIHKHTHTAQVAAHTHSSSCSTHTHFKLRAIHVCQRLHTHAANACIDSVACMRVAVCARTCRRHARGPRLM